MNGVSIREMGAGVKRALQPRGHWLLAPTLLTRRTTLALIVGIGVVIGLVFGIVPQLDLRISALFYDPVQRTWPAADSALFISYRNLSYYLPIILVMIAVVARAIVTLRRRASLLSGWRVAVFLLGSFLLGPGLITNVLLKPRWGRPRPAEVTQFGGHLDFTPWWNPFGQCDGNCSFVSGEESVAVWLVALALVLPARYRGAALAIAVLHCALMGLDRMAMGGHFASDVLFAVVFNALSIWAIYCAVFRNPASSPVMSSAAAI